VTDTPWQHPFAKLPPELRIRIWELSLPSSRVISVHCGADMPEHVHEPEPRSFFPAEHFGYSLSAWETQYCPQFTPDTRLLPPPHPLPTTYQDPGYTEVLTDMLPSELPRSTKNICASIAPVPSHLHACAESRSVALTHYRLSFPYCGQEPRIFFRPETDILYFGPRPGYMAANSQLQLFLSTTDRAHLATVRRIAVDDAVFWTDGGYRTTQTTSRPAMGLLGMPDNSSMQAVSNTVDALGDIRSRMPALEEIIFIPQGGYYAPGTSLDDVRVALRYQIQTAMNNISQRMGAYRTWEGPRWSILEYPLSGFALTSRHGMELNGTPVVADTEMTVQPLFPLQLVSEPQVDVRFETGMHWYGERYYEPTGPVY
jgi:hypothetical protein